MSSENVDAAKVAEGPPQELASRPKEKKEKAPKPNKNAGLEVRGRQDPTCVCALWTQQANIV